MPIFKKWTKLENDILCAGIMKYGLNRWSKISSLLQNRTPEECRAHWSSISPLNTPFTKQELLKLIDLHKIFKNQWNLIAYALKNKSPEQCRIAFEKIQENDFEGLKLINKIEEKFDYKKQLKEENQGDKETKMFVLARLENNKGRKEIKKLKIIKK